MRGKRQADAVLSLMGGEAFMSELDTLRRLFFAITGKYVAETPDPGSAAEVTAIGYVLDAGREFAKKLSYGRVEKADAEGGSNGT